MSLIFLSSRVPENSGIFSHSFLRSGRILDFVFAERESFDERTFFFPEKRIRNPL